MNTDDIAVVLVEPQGPGNIGSISRVMHNFGFYDLRLVNPRTDHLAEESIRMAVRAHHILENAAIFQKLADALEDRSLVFATTRRAGKYRKIFITPEDAAKRMSALAGNANTAFVFGREDNGLKASEIELCHHFVTIPTSAHSPSMNVSHAVCLMLYEAVKQRDDNLLPENKHFEPASVNDLEQMYSHMKHALLSAGYLNMQNPDHLMRAYRRIFGRAGLDNRDVRILRGLWSRMEWLAGETNLKKK